ncbi:MAG: hypothetical protein ACRD2T_00305 [Thermoanaerobaculia bacterium]
MSAPSRGAALVLLPESPRPAAEIGRILSFQLGIHPSDAIARVRYGGGVLLSGIGDEEAEELRERLLVAGVLSRRVDAALLEGLPRGSRARSVEIGDGEVRFRHPGGAARSIPREGLRAFHLYALTPPGPSPSAAGALAPRSPWRSLPGLRALAGRPRSMTLEDAADEARSQWFRRHHHDLGESVALTPRGRKLREALVAAGSPPPVLQLTLIPAEPLGPVRLSHDDLDHSALGAEKLPHSLDNFILLLQRLERFAPKAWMARRLKEFLDRLNPEGLLYFKPEEAQNQERWMQLWIRLSGEP